MYKNYNSVVYVIYIGRYYMMLYVLFIRKLLIYMY